MKSNFKSTDTIEEESNSNEKKRCTICGTNKTPLWRSGPAGPKSLCNACGIKNRKRRRTVIGIRSEHKKKKNQRWKKLGEEEEQAAVLLMTLYYASSVYA